MQPLRILIVDNAISHRKVMRAAMEEVLAALPGGGITEFATTAEETQLLLTAFDALIARGHTIIVIEHNLDIIKCADYVIDLGPEGGDMGGNLVCAGTPEDIVRNENSLTGKYLAGKIN